MQRYGDGDRMVECASKMKTADNKEHDNVGWKSKERQTADEDNDVGYRVTP